jgi:hypothetical protein
MAKQRNQPRTKRPHAPWPTVLVAMAAEGREDGGVGLQDLLAEAGFAEKPAMSIIVKRPPRPRLLGRGSSGRGREREIVDPCVDDVLDALRALCA